MMSRKKKTDLKKNKFLKSKMLIEMNRPFGTLFDFEYYNITNQIILCEEMNRIDVRNPYM